MTTKKTLKLALGKMIYHDQEFIDSDIGRPIRILSEFMGPNQIFAQEGVKNTIVFFGSARTLPMSEIVKRRKKCKSAKELERLKGSNPSPNTTTPHTNSVQSWAAGPTSSTRGSPS